MLKSRNAINEILYSFGTDPQPFMILGEMVCWITLMLVDGERELHAQSLTNGFIVLF